MSEVTLINPLTFGMRLPPLGLLYLASYLEEHGVSVEVVDPLSRGGEDYRSESPYTGITCMSTQFGKAREIARKIKAENPETTVVLGGVHPTVATEEAASDPNLDIVVVGEGEKAILRIVRENIREGIVYGERIEDLDEIPFPARHLVDMDWYARRDGIVIPEWIRATSVITSRGCQFSCHYCINSKHKMFGGRVRYHSADYVKEEVEEIASDYGVDGIFFTDDNFTSNRNRLMDICEGIKGFGLKWNCASRVDTLNRPMLEGMKEAGCVSIGFGVESGSQRVLNALNKRASIEDAIKVFDLCKEVGVKTWAFIIIGNPEETRQDIELTDKLLSRLKADFVGVSYLTPYKGTVIYDQAREGGWMPREDTSWFLDEPQMAINFSLDELKEIRDRLTRRHNSKLRAMRAYAKSPYFVYDMLKLVARNPALLFKFVGSAGGSFETSVTERLPTKRHGAG